MEYLIVRDLDNNIVGKRPIKSKVMAENVSGVIINGSLLFSFRAFIDMQELAATTDNILE